MIQILKLVFIFLVMLRNSTFCQVSNTPTHEVYNCKLVVIDGLIFIIEESNELFTKDTISVLDFGDVGNNCFEGRNSDFNNKEYNYFKEYKGKQPYFDKIKGDSIIAWFDARIFVLNAYVKYSNLRAVPTVSQYYHKVEYNNKIYVFKCITNIDVNEIWIIRKGLDSARFLKCYFPFH